MRTRRDQRPVRIRYCSDRYNGRSYRVSVHKECNGKIVIDDTLKAAIDAYYKQYGAK